jgi:hypothetical protein
VKFAQPTEGAASVNYLMMQYIYLQALDFLTTAAFLAYGIKEANPVVRAFLELGSTPLSGLFLLKLLAVGLGIFCWKLGRHRLLSRVNGLFALLVVWNLVALIAGRFTA